MFWKKHTEPAEGPTSSAPEEEQGGATKKRRWRKVAIVLVVVVAAGAAGSWSYAKSRRSAAQAEPELPATTTLQTLSFDQRVTADGTTEAADPYSIYIELSQEVDEVFVEVGDYVEEGQLLVTYDIDDQRQELEDQLQQAQVNLENAQLSLEEMARPAEGTELLDLQSAVLSAQETLKQAQQAQQTGAKDLAELEKNLPYYAQLLENGAISQSEYDSYEDEYETLQQDQEEAQSQIESAQLSLERAELNLSYGQDPLSDPSVQTEYQRQQNSILTYQRNIASIQEDLGKLTEATYSPTSGTVITCNAEEGQMLTDATVMMEVADLTNLDVSAYVSEYDIADVEVGQAVELTTDGIEDKVYHGTVTKIEPVAESQGTITGSETVVPIVVHLEDPDDLIKPGFSFDMEIIVMEADQVPALPLSAVTKERDSSQYSVFVVGNDGVLEKRAIEVGEANDAYIEVLSGLSAEETVVEVALDDMQDGQNLSDYASVAPAASTDNTSESSVLDSVTGGMGGGGMGGGPMGGPR